MALETASYVANLVESNPDGGDQRSTADDHIRLLKAALKRTFPKLDAAVSLSATQVMFLGDLSASVQLQLNQLRDGSATANFAVSSRYANSASVAAFIGNAAAADVARLSQNNTFTGISQRISGNTPEIGLQNTAASSGSRAWLWVAVGPQLRHSVYEDGWAGGGVSYLTVTRSATAVAEVRIDAATITLNGAVVGTISNATLAATATNAVNATNATNAASAAFATSAGSSALLSGLAPSELDFGNTIAERNSSGDLFARYLNQSSGAETNSVGHVITMTGLDGYHRVTPIATVGSYMEARNITNKAGTRKTLLAGSGPPDLTGSTNGDIWEYY